MRILHVLRAPVGGLFRHVRDLAEAQAGLGHAVGVVADARTGADVAEEALAALAPLCALGVSRTSMPRQIGPADITAARHVAARARESGADVVHGHGAKGGAYARLARAPAGARVYTPHGGSLHYDPRRPAGMAFLGAERAMLARTDAAIFESAYARAEFEGKVGRLPALAPVVHNGLTEADFAPVRPAENAADFVFVGELRRLKGVGILLDALAAIPGARAAIVGAGPDEAAFRRAAAGHGLDGRIVFHGAMPARQAFALGRCLVVPSLAESLPYIVLEAAAAGMPLIASRVGGIPEILSEPDAPLVPPADAQALAGALGAFLAAPEAAARAAEARIAAIRARFHARAMCERVLEVYRDALDPARLARAGAHAARAHAL